MNHPKNRRRNSGKYLPGCRYTDWKSAFLGTSGVGPRGEAPRAVALRRRRNQGRRRPTIGRRLLAGYGRGSASPLQSVWQVVYLSLNFAVIAWE